SPIRRALTSSPERATRPRASCTGTPGRPPRRRSRAAGLLLDAHPETPFGFWAGDRTNPLPAYCSYTAPEPAGLPGCRAAATDASTAASRVERPSVPNGFLAILHAGARCRWTD